MARVKGAHLTQRGTILVIVAFMALGLAAVTGMAADLGAMYYQRTKMQAAADAAALAGADALHSRNHQRAISLAEQYAQLNGYSLSDSDVTFPAKDRIQVSLQSPASLPLVSLLGLPTPGIGATATGEQIQAGNGGGMRPFGVPDSDFQEGREYLLKTGAGSALQGNYQALAIGGTGAADYEQNILYGSTDTVAVNQSLETEPGDMVGPTDTAVNQLVGDDQTPFEQALASPSSTPRVVTVALLNPAQWSQVTGRSEVEVTGFAQFYLIAATGGEVDARFISRVSESSIAGSTARYTEKLVL